MLAASAGAQRRDSLRAMSKVIPLRYGTAFKKAFGDAEVFSRFASDVLGVPIHIEAVHQEYSYEGPVGRVKVAYDLFGEDVEHRIVVELQHIREQDFFARFLHYHVVSIAEQARTHEDYRSERTVYTVVVLTTAPRARDLRFSVAVSEMDPVSEQGQRLGVYRHRLVFLNPKVINDQTPPAARRWMELIADSLDGEVEDAHYPDPLMKRVLGAIRDEELSPEELARIKDESAWENAKRDAAHDAIVEHARVTLTMLVRAVGLPLDEAALARIDACDDGATLQRWTLRVPSAKSVAELFED